MNSLKKGSILILIALVVANCSGDYRKKAVGSFGEAVVLMDSTRWNSQTSEVIKDTYGQAIKTLPNWEALFDLRFHDFTNNEELEQIKKNKNIIIATPIGDTTNVGRLVRAILDEEVEQRVREGKSFAFPLQDHWYRDQWAIILTSTSDSVLAGQISSTRNSLGESLMEKEFERWTAEIYDEGEKYELEDSLWTTQGWKIRIQHDWVKNIDTTYRENGYRNHFMTMRRPLPNNDRWFWAWWRSGMDTAEFLNSDWINNKRDSLMKKWMRGSREESYLTTEYRRPVNTNPVELEGHKAYETLGTWRMTNDAMGGPFANMTVYDESTGRLFIFEFGQFAPKYNKRRFVRQFRTMLRTFQSDSSWNRDTLQPKTARK